MPAVLKLLGYPYNIQRGALQSVGAPHAWPPILASLAWLVDLLSYSELSHAEAEAANDGFDDAAGEKMFFEYCAEGYALFLRARHRLLLSPPPLRAGCEARVAGGARGGGARTRARDQTVSCAR